MTVAAGADGGAAVAPLLQRLRTFYSGGFTNYDSCARDTSRAHTPLLRASTPRCGAASQHACARCGARATLCDHTRWAEQLRGHVGSRPGSLHSVLMCTLCYATLCYAMLRYAMLGAPVHRRRRHAARPIREGHRGNRGAAWRGLLPGQCTHPAGITRVLQTPEPSDGHLPLALRATHHSVTSVAPTLPRLLFSPRVRRDRSTAWATARGSTPRPSASWRRPQAARR